MRGSCGIEGGDQLHLTVEEYIKSLIHEGFLDDQFRQLQELEDESNPNFVFEVVSLFFDDAERLLNELTKSLDQQVIDYKVVDSQVHQLKGSSSSIGANRVHKISIAFRNCCDEKNVDGCRKCLQQLRNEYLLTKSKLETLFQLEGHGCVRK